MKSVKVKTPAKINLTLEVINKREDGYHNIESIMQTVNLYDFVTICLEKNSNQENQIEISGNTPLIPYEKTNLGYISAEKYLNTANIKGKKVKIFIEKNIPVAAGLAGGSSNAAGVLYALNYLFDNLLDEYSLSKLASEIGADVNFCLKGGTMLASGIGEKLKKIPTPNLNIIIAKPKNLSISAKEAYQNYSLLKNKPEYSGFEPMINAIKNDNNIQISNLLKNNLENGILNNYPKIIKLKEKLKQIGCLNSLMSGSGPSVFGIYTDKIKYSELESSEYNVFLVKTSTSGITFE